MPIFEYQKFDRQMILEILALIGFIGLACFLIRILVSLLPCVLPEQNLYRKYGHGYALVTGGTDGIGLSITRKLISQGISVYVVGLDAGKLSSHDLPEGSILRHDDLGDPNVVKGICQWIKEYRPILLINCAGLCVPSSFLSVDSPSHYVETYLSSLVDITQAFLHARQSRGGIVFFSSQVSYWTSPFASLYAATKSFTSQFANSLAVEFPKIDFLILHPGAVNGTSFFNSFPNYWFFNFIRFFGQNCDTVSSLVFRSLGRIKSVDSGIYAILSRVFVSLFDSNLLNFIGWVASGPLQNKYSNDHQNMPL